MKSGEKRKKEFSFLHKTNIRILSLQQPAESQAGFFLFFLFLFVFKNRKENTLSTSAKYQTPTEKKIPQNPYDSSMEF